MPTPGERRALVFIAAIAALGVAVRGWKELRSEGRAGAGLMGDRTGLARQIEAVDSAIAAGGVRHRGRGAKGQGAGESQGVSRRRRVPSAVGVAPPPQSWSPDAERGSRRPRRSVEQASPHDAHESYRRRWERADSVRRLINERDGFVPQRLPPGRRSRRGSRAPSRPSVFPPVDLDTAPLEEISSVAQIGPALARRIVIDRIERGPFGSISGLERVRGMSKSLARRLQPYVTFSLASRLESVPEASVPVRRRRRP